MKVVLISTAIALLLTLGYFFAFGVYLQTHHGFDKGGWYSGPPPMYEALTVFDPVHVAMDRSPWIERRLYDCAGRANLGSALTRDHVKWLRHRK
jgi:hypothetical protein